MTRLTRSLTAGGTRIHLASCRYAGPIPWDWAEGRDDNEWLRLGWLRPCRVCLPDQAKRQDELQATARP